ncbi:MAG: AAA family ATPase [Bacteroidia bacterium]|nr:AAA family ATPase [Bacteroidia bacterium]
MIGGNNSGKTTLLQSMALFDFVIHNCLNRKQHNGNLIYEVKNRSIQPEEFVVLPVANTTDLWADRITQRNGKHILISITITFDNGRKAKATIDLNFNRFTISLETSNEQHWLEDLSKFKISYLPVFSTFLTQEERRTPAIIEDALARGRVNSVIRNLLFDLRKEEGKIQKLENILQNAIPTFNKLTISFDEIVDRYIDVSYFEEGKKKDFNLFMAGSGFQQFVYLFGFINLRNPNVILLDEPDVHLHGALQASLLRELKKLVDEGKQVIFATHSRDIITRVEPNQTIFLSDENAYRLKVNYEIYDALESLGSIDTIQIAQIQVFRRLLIVEDIDDWKFIQIFGKKVLGEGTWQKVEKHLAICPAKGNPYKQDMSRLKSQLTSMLSLSGHGSSLKLFVVCDLDYYPYRDELIGEKNRQDSDVCYHIWERSEIENYLLVNDAILRLVGSKPKSQNLYTTPLEKEIEKLIDSSKDRIEEKLIEGLNYYNRNKEKRWDPVTLLRKAKEIINADWDKNKLSMTDAKEIVLPGIKRWLQANAFDQFSDLSLAENLSEAEIADEIKETVKAIGIFADI